jgi:hypothetical protein
MGDRAPRHHLGVMARRIGADTKMPRGWHRQPRGTFLIEHDLFTKPVANLR